VFLEICMQIYSVVFSKKQLISFAQVIKFCKYQAQLGGFKYTRHCFVRRLVRGSMSGVTERCYEIGLQIYHKLEMLHFGIWFRVMRRLLVSFLFLVHL